MEVWLPDTVLLKVVHGRQLSSISALSFESNLNIILSLEGLIGHLNENTTGVGSPLRYRINSF